MAEVEEQRARGNVTEIKLAETPWWRFSCDDGTVTISAEAGKNITNERALWLLEKAKRKVTGTGL